MFLRNVCVGFSKLQELIVATKTAESSALSDKLEVKWKMLYLQSLNI